MNNVVNSPGDISFTPGVNGAIIWRDQDRNELMRLDLDGLHLFGLHIPKTTVVTLLQKLDKIKKSCNCSMQQIMHKGCVCGGS